MKGYSITVPVIDPDGAPVSTVMDESYKVAITRLGDRIRVGGTAEISGYSDKLDAARRATLDHSLTDMFPRGGDLAKATFWCGLRPMTPDGPPVIGATRYGNLHLNTGHGTLGWTMACGSGRVLADLLSGRKPDIDASELDDRAGTITGSGEARRIAIARLDCPDRRHGTIIVAACLPSRAENRFPVTGGEDDSRCGGNSCGNLGRGVRGRAIGRAVAAKSRRPVARHPRLRRREAVDEKTSNSMNMEKSAVVPEAGGANSAAPTVQSGGKPMEVRSDCPPDSKPK